jgi:hypothetical protein
LERIEGGSMNLREAAQQALEALEAWEDAAPSQWTTRDEKTITALRAALEQPEQVDVLAEYTGDGTHRQWVSTGAWLMPGERVLHAGAGHPPRREWRGLSKDESLKLWGMRSDGPSNLEIIGFARAIEQALRSKNEQA